MASPEIHTTVCLLGAMDKLWFQSIVLSPESNNKSPDSSSLQSQSSSSSNSSYTDCSDDDLAHQSSSTMSQNVLELQDDHKNESFEEEKPVRQTKRTRPIRRRVKTRIRVLERTVSCKTPVQLEEEEVKGFIDLGFKFDKDRITPNMISVVPGLQRLGGEQDGEIVVVAGEEGRRKPYLSESWVIKRPESPLLRLRMPNRVSANAKSNDMKNHLKLWAKTVAYSALGDE